jgi:hypothetical protein
MKYLNIFTVLSTILLCFTFSCSKIIPVPITDPCESAYDLRSKPYINLYKGLLPSCLASLQYYEPEPFSYSGFCTNPNNEYEFCFLRENNQTNNTSLYKYNFCTNSLSLIIENIKYTPDWSVKDWIIFFKGNNIWKIKSSGDSLTKLNANLFTYALWSPSGSKYIEASKIMDENGVEIGEIPYPPYKYIWETDTTFICTKLNNTDKSYEITRYNIKSKKDEVFYTGAYADIINIHDYNAKSFTLYFSINEKGKNKYLKINTKTGQSIVMGIYENSYVPRYYEISKDKLLVNLSLKDTLTGKLCSVNQRNHVAITNLEGTNERQVIIPE